MSEPLLLFVFLLFCVSNISINVNKNVLSVVLNKYIL